jgi:hypothetical protein
MEENEYLTKFKGLLNELFQFEASGLDFGVSTPRNFLKSL